MKLSGSFISIVFIETGDLLYRLVVLILTLILAYLFTKFYAGQKKGQYNNIKSYKKTRISRDECIIEIIYKNTKHIYLKSGQAMVLVEKEDVDDAYIEKNSKTLYFKGVLKRYIKKEDIRESGKKDYEEK